MLVVAFKKDADAGFPVSIDAAFGCNVIGDVEVEEFDRGVMSGQGIDPGVRDFDHACVASDVAVRIFALEKLR